MEKTVFFGGLLLHNIEESEIVDVYFISSKFTLDALQR